MKDEVGGVSASLGRPWWVRLRAVLATGLVLGAGATTTLAAWTDQVIAEGSFSASTFVIEVNSSTPYDEAENQWAAAADQAAVLQFDAAGMTPGSTRYAAVALRVATGSIGGTAVLNGAAVDSPSGDLGAHLQYRVIDSASCSEEAFGAGADYRVGGPNDHEPLTAGQDDQTAALELAPATADGPGTPVNLCFEVILPAGAPNDLQGQAAIATWSFDATSETT